MLERTKVAGWVLRAAFALVALASTSAAAQEHDPAAAQALFDQARQLIAKGSYREACPKLVESNRLDPGIGTQFHLADCYEKNGQIATAWATFLDVASVARSSNQLEREKVALKRASQLEARLPKLTVNVAEASKSQGVEVRRDGVLVGSVQWGVPVPVDPGEHVLTATAPGYKPYKQAFQLEASKAASFEVPALESDGASPAAAALPVGKKASTVPSAASIAPDASPAERAPEPREKTGSVSALPLVLAAVGVVGLGVSTGFALKANSTNKRSKDDCLPTNPNLCSASGQDLRSDALAQGNIATISFISGGALLAAAVIVWRVEAGSTKKPAPTSSFRMHPSASIAPGSAALYLQGGF